MRSNNSKNQTLTSPLEEKRTPVAAEQQLRNVKTPLNLNKTSQNKRPDNKCHLVFYSGGKVTKLELIIVYKRVNYRAKKFRNSLILGKIQTPKK